jgi:uncharacterized protein (DUF2235 family)
MTTEPGLQPVHPPRTEARPQLPQRKNIVICCDGTGNDYSRPNPTGPKDKRNGYNSNVVKLYTALEVNNQQVAYYHPGVGTMGAPTATHWITREWSRIKGLAFGAGFRDNVLDAYRYLMQVYNDNGGHGNEDRVFIFGFSRGAYTARALAGLLHCYGLLCRGNEGHLPYAWRMYVYQHKIRTRRQVKPDDTFRRTFSHENFLIHFMGVWDTVSSVGWVYSPLQLFDVAVNPSIQHARHAVSIDEHRCFFMDNLYDDHTSGTEMVQAWFPGVHSDVGGSYSQPETGMAYTSLKWMLREAEAKGLAINQKREALVMGDGHEHDPLNYEKPISWMLHRSLTLSWWIPEIIPHGYYNKDFNAEYMRVPLGLRLRQLPDGALVHGSVWERMHTQMPGAQPYHPRNCPEEALKPDPLGRVAKDGTLYRCFMPEPRTKSPLLTWLDRYVVTWAFSIFDIVVFVPGVLFVLAMVLGIAAMVSLKLVELGWNHATPPFWHTLARWWLSAMHRLK